MATNILSIIKIKKKKIKRNNFLKKFLRNNHLFKILLDLINQMETCSICYEDRSPIKFFYLSCCEKNKICFVCLEKLCQPKCPYCRQTIIGFHKRSKTTKQYEEPWNFGFNGYTSRIERKQMRRLLKLEMWEHDRVRNRMRSFSM